MQVLRHVPEKQMLGHGLGHMPGYVPSYVLNDLPEYMLKHVLWNVSDKHLKQMAQAVSMT